MCIRDRVKLDPDAARELVDALGADMMMVASEMEKLLLYVTGKGRITLGDVETLSLIHISMRLSSSTVAAPLS